MNNPASLKGYAVLIVDGGSRSAADLSNRFSALGAKVHVMDNTASALTLTHSKRLDVALISFEREPILKRALQAQGVRISYVASRALPHDMQRQ